MGNSLRCCLACVLPCGALDLIRIVHLNGQVDEIHRPITAGEVLKENPRHMITKPCSNGVNSRKILILSPETELKRGEIYFLIPDTSMPDKKKEIKENGNKIRKMKSEKKRIEKQIGVNRKKRHDNEVWKPHLDSIFEDQYSNPVLDFYVQKALFD